MERKTFSQLPLGVSDFHKLRELGKIYVDKTGLLYDLITTFEKVFLARPRRFGKSLLVSTFESLFKYGTRDFKGLAIEKLWKDKTYKVIRLDFSNLKDFSSEEEGIWYCYGFSATRKCICEEHLYWAPKGQKSVVVDRKYQDFSFPVNGDKKIKEMISKAVAPNQLFFAVSCTMNYEPCIEAMKWFRTKLFFSRDYSDLGKNLLEYSDDSEMLKSVASIAKIADIGISDMKFEIDNKAITSLDDLPEDFPMESRLQIEKALSQFKESLSGDADNVNGTIQYNELKATSFHTGLDAKGKKTEYPLSLSDESDGTIRLMARATALESALKNGGILVIDEIEDRLHPMLVEYIIKRFQHNNETKAQLIFTTHSVDIMNREMLRRDQYYLVDKNSETGVSELYSISDFSVRNDEKVGKAYLLGKYGAVPYIREE